MLQRKLHCEQRALVAREHEVPWELADVDAPHGPSVAIELVDHIPFGRSDEHAPVREDGDAAWMPFRREALEHGARAHVDDVHVVAAPVHDVEA